MELNENHVTKTLVNRTLKWYGLVKRMPHCRWSKRISDCTPHGKREQEKSSLYGISVCTKP